MSTEHASSTAFLDGGRRMGALMRSLDWTASPLGPPATWPDTLKGAVATCLSSHFPMVIWWGPDLLMLYNDAWQPILGETKHPSGLGRPGAESWPETWPIVGVQFQNALNGVASWSEDLLLSSDRHGFLEECYFTYSHSPLKDPLGHVVGVCSIVSETTSRVLNERRLRVLRDLSSATIDATTESASIPGVCQKLIERLALANPDVPFAIQYVTDPDGSARLCASAGSDGSLFPALVGAHDADEWGIAQALRSRTPVTIGVSPGTLHLPGGAWPEPTTQVMSLPLLRSNVSADPCGVLLVGLNSRLQFTRPYADFLRLVAAQLASAISALQLLENERAARVDAERAARVKDEFLAMLSHELRTPLNAIIGWTEILKRDLPDPKLALTAVKVIDRNARKQARLVSDLLDISRITSGGIQLDVQSCDLRAVIGAAIEVVKPAAAEKTITLRPCLGLQPLVINGDPVRLQQVAWNLLVNAIKFTPAGGSVTIELAATGTHAELRVTDTGEGLDPFVMSHIFEGFRQGDASPSRRHEGLGLGLTIVKRLVELHGGCVTAASDGLGQGATFTVRLPYPKSAERRAPGSPPRPRPSALDRTPLRDARVLLIDDDQDAVEMMRRFIEDESGQVRTASTVTQALDILANERFDLIVSDIAMPGGDGYGLIAEIRRRGVATPAVALTAFAHAKDRDRALAGGYQAHIAKPIDSAELLTIVVELVRSAKG